MVVSPAPLVKKAFKHFMDRTGFGDFANEANKEAALDAVLSRAVFCMEHCCL